MKYLHDQKKDMGIIMLNEIIVQKVTTIRSEEVYEK